MKESGTKHKATIIVVSMLVILGQQVDAEPWYYHPQPARQQMAQPAGDHIPASVDHLASASFVNTRGGMLEEAPQDSRHVEQSRQQPAAAPKGSRNEMAQQVRAMVRSLRSESLLKKLLKQLILDDSNDVNQEYIGGGGNENDHNGDDEELRRLDRNYYGWLDFGKRSISDDDFNY